MKKKIVYSVALFLAIVLQASVLPLVCPDCVTGDIVLAVVLAGAVLEGFSGFIWWAVIAGIIYDLANYDPVGLHALAYLSVVYFVSFFSRRFSVEIKGVGIALFGVFVVVGTLASRLVAVLGNFEAVASKNHFVLIFGNLGGFFLQIIINAILFAACFILLRKIKKSYL